MFNKLFYIFLNPIFLLLIVGILISISIYSYLQFDEAQTELKKVRVELEELRKSPEATSAEIRILVDQVGRIVALPPNETPTVATITDIEKLREQPFFANAQNGDKILIYRNARKAFLYRPDDNKIIEVAPINIAEQPSEGETGEAGSDNQDAESPTGTPTSRPTQSPEATGSGENN